MNSLKEKAFNGVLWTIIQQFGVQAVNFVVQIVLARLLLPEMFGLIAMLTVFINIGYMLMNGGMISSLIRTDAPDQLDYSTVFVTNLLMSLFAYVAVYITAPAIATFYDQTVITKLLRVFALTFVIRSLVAVHIAKLIKELKFKTEMKLQIPCSILSASVGVIMAFSGFGVWSLVALEVTNTLFFTLFTWLIVDWRPSFVFNIDRFKYHFNFGFKITISGLLDIIYNNIYNIIIGKAFAPSVVGYFNRADTLKNFPVNQVSLAVNKVTYPLFSSIKGDNELKTGYKLTMKVVFFVVVPLMLILAVCAREVILFLFGSKWIPSIIYFQILAFASIVVPLSSYNINILKVKGRSDLILKIGVYKKIIGLLIVLFSVKYGVIALVFSYLILTYCFCIIDMLYSGKFIAYSLGEQIKDCFKIFLFGLISFVISYYLKGCLVGALNSNLLIIVIISTVFLSVYLILTYFFEKEVVNIIKDIWSSFNKMKFNFGVK